MEWYWVGWFLGFAFGVGVSAAVWGLYLGSTWALLKRNMLRKRSLG